MDVRKPHDFSRGLILALVVPAFLAGCATPRTHFDWGVNTRVHHRTAVASRKYYTYKDTTTYQDAYAPRVVPRPRPEPGWYQDSARPAPRDSSIEPAPANADLQFTWPVNGRVISNFGTTTGGERNDGINIAAPYGEPIHAAADGTVTYAGNDLKSYGNLVLIRHGDNYVTAYAHADRIAVNRGDHVVKGQVIAYAGNTGDVSQPQLHFEIRRGVRPINPRPLLGPLQVASR
ncbi:MAG: M23 family metallopeptidase [Rhizomicrobium sp.]|jgi:murein DD-endopeptidase MepM/ murein hydrolase activator NlpD